jgi:pseudaminic acid biosynthesis-associated methylase
MVFNSEQEKFWAKSYASEYIKKNSEFDHILGAEAWKNILSRTQGEVKNYLECGCNIGRNITQISLAFPESKPSIIEISDLAYKFCISQHNFVNTYHGSILNSNFDKCFDLVFTMGVLIHINPQQLLENMAKIFSYSNKYILIGEYFNPSPVAIDYQGESDKLFKRDFGKLFIENFEVELIDHGFLWSYVWGPAGFDDITWWLFKKS